MRRLFYILLITSSISLLSACGGGSGGSPSKPRPQGGSTPTPGHVVNPVTPAHLVNPAIPAHLAPLKPPATANLISAATKPSLTVSSNCTSSKAGSCYADASLIQGDFSQDASFAVHLTLSQGSKVLQQKTLTLSASNIDWKAVNLNSNTAYVLTAYSSDVFGRSSSVTVNFKTPAETLKPLTPQIDITDSCQKGTSGNCQAQFAIDQTDYSAGLNFVVHLNLTQGSHAIANKTISLQSQHSQWSVPGLNASTSYQVTGFTSNTAGNGPSKTQTFTTPPTPAAPLAPSNIKANVICSSQNSCPMTISFDQPLSKTQKSLAGISTKLTVYDVNNPDAIINTGTLTQLKVTGNSYQVTNSAINPGHTYALTLNTFDNNGRSQIKTLYFRPNFIFGNAAFVYFAENNLVANGNKQYSSDWQGDLQGLHISYFYPSLGDVDSVINAAGESYASYRSKHTAYQGGATADGFNYNMNINGTLASGSAYNGAFKAWNLNTPNVITRVLPIVAFSSAAQTQMIAAQSGNNIPYLARSIADTILADPNADGVIFDNEKAIKTATGSGNWYTFYQDVATYLKQDAATYSHGQQKLLAVYGNAGTFNKICKPGTFATSKCSDSSDSLWYLLGQKSAVCQGAKCYIVLALYDNGSVNGALDQLINSSNPKHAFSYYLGSGLTYPDGDTGMLLQNQDYFQFGISASGSTNTWAAASLFKPYQNLGINVDQYPSVINLPGICAATWLTGAAVPTACTSTIGQVENNRTITMTTYLCDYLQTFNLLMHGQTLPGLCSNAGELAAITKAAPGFNQYFMGLALYRIADEATAIRKGKSSYGYVTYPVNIQNLRTTDPNYWNMYQAWTMELAALYPSSATTFSSS